MLFMTVGIRVRFASNGYTGLEATGFMIVTLEFNRGISTYPFNVTITPSERSPVSAEGKCIIIIHYAQKVFNQQVVLILTLPH